MIRHDEALGELADALGCDHVVMYDDTWRGMPGFQRETYRHTCTYERILFSAALASHSIPTTAALRKAPAPSELEFAYTHSGPYGLHVTLLLPDGPVDLGDLNERGILRLAESAPETPALRSSAEAGLAQLGGTRHLLLPYQTLSEHHQMWGSVFTLPTSAAQYSNKARAIQSLVRLGLGNNVPDGTTCPRGSAIQVASHAIAEVDKLQSTGRNAYIKLSQVGVGGLANVIPTDNPEIYDSATSAVDRARKLARLIVDRHIPSHTEVVRVEERVPKAMDSLGSMEFTVGGVLVMGKFQLTYIGRNLNTSHDSTAEMLHSESALPLGIGTRHGESIAGMATQVFECLGATGYPHGYAYGDVILRPDGGIVMTDFNLRRGLRSSGEALLALKGGMWLDTAIQVGPVRNIHDIQSIQRRAGRIGAHWYGSPSMLQSTRVNLLIPAETILIQSNGTGLPTSTYAGDSRFDRATTVGSSPEPPRRRIFPSETAYADADSGV